MTKYTAFTSFNRRLWDIIGSQMIASWLHWWPQDAKLVVFLEDDIELPADPRLDIRPWKDTVDPLYQSLDQRSQHLPTWQSNQSHRFGKKAMTFYYFLEQSNLDRVIWLDADLLTLKPVTWDIFDRVLENYAAAIFDKPGPDAEGKIILTAESGFVLFDTQHPGFKKIYQDYCGYYDRCVMPEQGRDFWDSEVLSHSCHRHPGTWKNLTPEIRGKSGTPLNHHIILGDYFQHVKTKKKKHYTAETFRGLWLNGVPLSLENSIYAPKSN